MRNIKFRGKDKFTGEWFYGHYLMSVFHNDLNNPHEEIHSIMTNDEVHNVDPLTVCQYIELLDYEKHELHHNDIVALVNVHGEHIPEYGLISYGTLGWYVSPLLDDDGISYTTIEVFTEYLIEGNVILVGNSFDNPELMCG